jgi:hypothetical protein
MATRAEPVTLTLYSRNCCRLCDEMMAALRELQAGACFELEVVDIEGAPELEHRYGELVPVLTQGDREICRYRLDATAITALLPEIR